MNIIVNSTLTGLTLQNHPSSAANDEVSLIQDRQYREEGDSLLK